MPLPSNHALIITVSEYARGSLPGVLTDRKIGVELAQRFGVPENNIVMLSEQQVTREGLAQALQDLNLHMLRGDKLFVYYSGHGARLFNQETNQCEESIVMQNMRLVSKNEFARMLKPLSAKADKTIVMLDSCHAGGLAQAAGTRAISAKADARPKFSAEASSAQCASAVNVGTFSQSRGIDLATTDNNIVILAAARKNEVAWDTSKGGAMTYNFQQCLIGGAADTDHSGSISMHDLTDCVQTRLDKVQDESMRQHATLAGNGALVPAFSEISTSASPTASIDTNATLNAIYQQRDDRWQIDVKLDQPQLKIGSNLALSVRSNRGGFVYLFYRGTQPDSFYLLFPNQLDSSNAIGADYELHLPRPSWSITALGPPGTDHILVMVTESARDFSNLSLPAQYVSAAGPFDKIQPTAPAAAKIGQIATLSAAANQPQCNGSGSRDLGIAHACSNVFGASLLKVDETN
jgi:Caspase domain/Domain of unknown function (DUF4384)